MEGIVSLARFSTPAVRPQGKEISRLFPESSSPQLLHLEATCSCRYVSMLHKHKLTSGYWVKASPRTRPPRPRHAIPSLLSLRERERDSETETHRQSWLTLYLYSNSISGASFPISSLVDLGDPHNFKSYRTRIRTQLPCLEKVSELFDCFLPLPTQEKCASR